MLDVLTFFVVDPIVIFLMLLEFLLVIHQYVLNNLFSISQFLVHFLRNVSTKFLRIYLESIDFSFNKFYLIKIMYKKFFLSVILIYLKLFVIFHLIYSKQHHYIYILNAFYPLELYSHLLYLEFL